MKFQKLALAALISAATLTSTLSYADVNADAEKAIKARLASIVPNAPEAQVVASPVAGLYQVSLGAKLIYMSADGQFLVDGEIVDLVSRTNVTEAAKNEVRKVAVAKLDASSMITYPAKGEVKAVATVFTDIDCPYCRKLHNEIPKLNAAGIEVRYMAYPRAGVGSPSYKKMVSVWCADDPAAAMTKAKSGQTVPDKTCANPVVEHMEQVKFFGINGTPNMILDTGEMIPGYVPAEKLIASLKLK